MPGITHPAKRRVPVQRALGRRQWWSQPRPTLGPDTKLGAWCWTWKGWASWWERGPAVADRPERGRIYAHVVVWNAWVAFRPLTGHWPMMWAVCGAKVCPGAPSPRYVRRCHRCRAVVGNDWWPTPRRPGRSPHAKRVADNDKARAWKRRHGVPARKRYKSKRHQHREEIRRWRARRRARAQDGGNPAGSGGAVV